MRSMMTVALLTGFAMLPGSLSGQTAERASVAFADRDGNDVGTGTLIEGPHGVLIDLDLYGLPPGRRAIHIHSIGTCDDPEEGFVASGGHLNPEGRAHGLMNPEGPDHGDLPNIIVREDGTVQVELFSHLASLYGAPGRAAILDEDGAALVIHQMRDDHISQPIGGAGPRIACGVVTPAE
ncbi:MAG: superoxide dismutase family protein [Gammaproteobacteria bacterium]|nr:superoxide dismutase family protein [Gammaproteobacteria bacterium]TVQ49707.1 MAG: superoxide dismutase family protein [Gammaproteobacteria bacterium]